MVGAFTSVTTKGASSAASSPTGSSISYSDTSTGSFSVGSSRSNTRGSYHTYSATASIDLSEASFSQRPIFGSWAESTARDLEDLSALSSLTVPTRPLMAARDIMLLQGSKPEQRASRKDLQSYAAASGEEPRLERAAMAKETRQEPSVVAVIHPNGERSTLREGALGAEAPAAKYSDRIANLAEESFSADLSILREEPQKPQADIVDEKREDEDPQAEIDEEERLTRYYRQVLNALVSSNVISEEIASFARGKRGQDLVAAVGIALSKANDEREEKRARQMRAVAA